MLKRFEDLPAEMRCEAIRPYYEALSKKRLSLFVKRVFDIVASAVVVALLSPVLLFIAILVKRSSPGPVIFRQERVTRYGRIFWIYKFRTMSAASTGAQVTVKDDPRVTNVGKKLRKNRLDELPQLLNVLLGDMSFVGTRPEVEKYVAAYTGEMRATLLMRAGITSNTSLKYRDEEQLLSGAGDPEAVYVNEILPAKMRMNLESLLKFSLAEDLKTIFSTVFGGM